MATATITSTWANENHDVKARVNYVSVESEISRPEDMAKPSGLGDFLPSSRYMTFHNARGKESSFEIDKNGFQFYTLPDKERDVSTDEKIKEEFYPEIEEVIKKVTGCSHVFATGHVLRRAENKIYNDSTDTERYNRWTTVWPHTDWKVVLRTEREERDEHLNNVLNAGIIDEKRVDEAKKVAAIATRWSGTQIWKPLKTLDRDPLALCDARSYDFSEWRLRTTADPKISFPVLTHGDAEEKHKWYYLHEMNPNEMFVFKGADSRQGEPGFTGYTGAHTAFILPDSEDKPPRESIEARFLCFWT